MPDPSSLRDSTQIVLPSDTLEELRSDLECEFTITIVDGDPCRIVGSPVEIKRVTDFLARNGVTLP